MKLFVCSDVHGNVRALDAVLARYREEQPCDFLFLGDCVGYGPHPAGCLQRIAGLPRAHLLLGNHDAALLDARAREDMNPRALEALGWSSREIGERERAILRERFTMQWNEEGIIAAHASPVEPERWTYVFSAVGAMEIFHALDFHVCFTGHTHLPMLATFDGGEVEFPADVQIPVDDRDRYVVNPGSVGQPRDGDPRAACLVYDTEAASITLSRIPYDIDAAIGDFRGTPIPAFYAERLREGK
ncbi:MAG: metallophosphoesterase family protein [Candidatus Krumholzibacteriota bacterium]|nr:metallophosphoesterase family protein [Candidatus Krumholzibacteriota bacterium]